MTIADDCEHYKTGWFDIIRIILALIVYVLWVPLFILQIFEFRQMIDLISQRDVKKIVYGEHDFSAKDENYLIEMK